MVEELRQKETEGGRGRERKTEEDRGRQRKEDEGEEGGRGRRMRERKKGKKGKKGSEYDFTRYMILENILLEYMHVYMVHSF